MNSEHIPNGQVSEAEKLGRFGHHPDPAIDFEIEVQSLEARLFDAKGGISKPGTEPETVETVGAAIERAMTFTVGGDPSAVAAKAILRNLEKEAWDYVHAKVTDDLQALGEEFGVLGGENRISGLRRVLTEMRSALTRRSSAGVKWLPNVDDLAQIIRGVRRGLGAGAMAEAILAALSSPSHIGEDEPVACPCVRDGRANPLCGHCGGNATSPSVPPQPCLCDRCQKPVTYDLILPDEVWARISPKPVDGWKSGGVLCPECIATALAGVPPQGETSDWRQAYERLIGWLLKYPKFTLGDLEQLERDIGPFVREPGPHPTVAVPALASQTQGEGVRPTYAQISDMVHACRERQKAAGEGDQMLSRWISEGLDALFLTPSPTLEPTDAEVERAAVAIKDKLWEARYREDEVPFAEIARAVLIASRHPTSGEK